MLRLVKRKIIHPLQRFIHDSRSVGITLLLCTGISLLLSNTGFWKEGYRGFWSDSFNGTELHYFTIGLLSFPNSPLLVINDFLMSIFFLLAGMEIKRELLTGELSSLKKSALPVFAAIGGMLIPAVLFSLFNKGSGYMSGWAIPTATDIAFTLGIASLLGNRIPVTLKIFLTALAIIDDLGAIVIIALFYGAQLHVWYLLAAILITVLLWFIAKKNKGFGWMQWLMGLALWYCMFHSGIHATVAGVLFAFVMPADKLTKLELALHKPVYFIIMPVFALANTAILLPENSIHILSGSLSLGVMAGLCIGKPLGIFLLCYFMVKKKIADLPRGVNWHKLAGAGMLAGIGFTMSIFIATLAFDNNALQDEAKIAVLLASLISILAGYFWLRYEPKNVIPIPQAAGEKSDEKN